MEFHRVARSALTGLSHSTITTAATAQATMPTLLLARPALAPVSSGPSSARLLSTTALRLAPPSRSWPPPRPDSSSSSPPNPSSSTTSPTAEIKNLYPTENPAQWAMWSVDDFNRRSPMGTGAQDLSGQGLPGQGQNPAGSGTSFHKYSEMSSLDLAPRLRELPFPLKPEAGKTAYVSHRTDVSRAFQLCNITLGINRTKMLWNKQRFHERPGLRRKRLASQTWRRKFRTAMITTVGRVKELARQGW